MQLFRYIVELLAYIVQLLIINLQLCRKRQGMSYASSDVACSIAWLS